MKISWFMFFSWCDKVEKIPVENLSIDLNVLLKAYPEEYKRLEEFIDRMDNQFNSVGYYGGLVNESSI